MFPCFLRLLAMLLQLVEGYKLQSALSIAAQLAQWLIWAKWTMLL